MTLKRERVFTEAPQREGFNAQVMRAKETYWEEETSALVSDIMDIGFLPDTKITIEFSTGGAKRQSRFRIDIMDRDLPALLDLMCNIGGPEFRAALRLKALQSIANYPRDMEKLFHEVKKNASVQAVKETENG